MSSQNPRVPEFRPSGIPLSDTAPTGRRRRSLTVRRPRRGLAPQVPLRGAVELLPPEAQEKGPLFEVALAIDYANYLLACERDDLDDYRAAAAEWGCSLLTAIVMFLTEPEEDTDPTFEVFYHERIQRPALVFPPGTIADHAYGWIVRPDATVVEWGACHHDDDEWYFLPRRFPDTPHVFFGVSFLSPTTDNP